MMPPGAREAPFFVPARFCLEMQRTALGVAGPGHSSLIGGDPTTTLKAMPLHQIRAFASQTVAALHDAGRHREAWQLSGHLYEIRYQPSESAAQLVMESAERLAA